MKLKLYFIVFVSGVLTTLFMQHVDLKWYLYIHCTDFLIILILFSLMHVCENYMCIHVSMQISIKCHVILITFTIYGEKVNVFHLPHLEKFV